MESRALLTTGCLFFTFVSAIAQADLTKKEAFELLKKNGFRWQEIGQLKVDAESKLTEAHAQFVPHLSLAMREYIGRVNQIQFGFGDPGSLTVFTAGSTGLQMNFSIFDQTALDRLEAAKQNEKLSQAQTEQYKNDLTYVLLAQYLNTQRLKRKIEVIDVSLKRDEEILKLANAKVKLGLGITVEQMRAEALLKGDHLRKIDAEFQFHKAKQDLANLVGQENLDSDLEPLHFRKLPQNKMTETNTDLIEKRPDVATSQLTVTVEENLVKSHADDVYPKVNLFGDVGVFGTHAIGGAGNAVTGTFGIQIEMPFYTGGFIHARAQEESARAVKADLETQQLRLQAKSQIELAISQLKESEEAVSLSQSQLEIANRELEIARRKFSAGASAAYELSTSLSNSATIADSNVDAVFTYELSKVNLFKATGHFDDYFASEESQAYE